MAKRGFGNLQPSQTANTTSKPIERELIRMPPRDLIKTTNARSVAFSFSEFASTAWPALTTPEDSLDEALLDAMTDQAWYQRLDPTQRQRQLGFMQNIHGLAQSLVTNGQLQPVVADREGYTAPTARLIAGERRVLASLYAGNAVSGVDVLVYNRPLSDAECARYQDQENAGRVQLETFEVLRSKLAIMDHLPEALPDLTGLAHLLGYRSKSSASEIASLWRSPHRDRIMDLAATKRLSWRKVFELVKQLNDDPNADIDAPRSTVEPVTPEKRLKRAGVAVTKRTDTRLLTTLLQAAIGHQRLPEAVVGHIQGLDAGDSAGLVEALDLLAVELGR